MIVNASWSARDIGLQNALLWINHTFRAMKIMHASYDCSIKEYFNFRKIFRPASKIDKNNFKLYKS